jgi:hypothetical protein
LLDFLITLTLMGGYALPFIILTAILESTIWKD